MKSTIHYVGPMEDRLRIATCDVREYLGVEKYNLMIESLAGVLHEKGTRPMIGLTRAYCAIAGIEGFPVRAIVKAATDFIFVPKKQTRYTLQIWHHNNPTFSKTDNKDDILKNLKDNYVYVATLVTRADEIRQALESVYSASQNIDSSWHNPPCRSSSVGDVFILINGETEKVLSYWEIRSFGFEQIT